MATKLMTLIFFQTGELYQYLINTQQEINHNNNN
jgi:hypothetical protein